MRVFSLADIWPRTNKKQRLQLGLTYLLNLSLAAAKPIAAYLLSTAFQTMADEEKTSEHFGELELTPQQLLYLSVAFGGYALLGSYLRTLLTYNVTDAMSTARIQGLLENLERVDYQAYPELLTEIKGTLKYAPGIDSALVETSVFNLQATSFELFVSTGLTFWLRGTDTGAFVAAYIMMAWVANELLGYLNKSYASDLAILNAQGDFLNRVEEQLSIPETLRLFNRTDLATNVALSKLGQYYRHIRRNKLIHSSESILTLFLIGLQLYYVYTIDTDKADIEEILFAFSLFNSFQATNLSVGQSMASATFAVDRNKKVKAFNKRLAGLKMKQPDVGKEMAPDIKQAKSALGFEGVNFWYGDKRKKAIINKLNFDFPKNKLTVIFGKTNLGKTTLLKLMTGLYQLRQTENQGRITLFGVNINSVTSEKIAKLITYVPQEPSFFEKKPVLYNLLLAFPDINTDILEDMSEMSTKEIVNIYSEQSIFTNAKAECEKYFSLLGLNPTLLTSERPIAKYTPAQKQIFALVRALLARTPIIAIDAVFSNLGSYQQQVVNALCSIHDKTLIVVTDYPALFAGKADKIYEFTRGSRAKKVTADTLVEKTADFMTLPTSASSSNSN